ncbi:MAG: type II toxin-antitoxin system MqsA family antitoxin [Oscillospiraceae bacterium]|jgi:putative zinc finger/helix-turn-helix YgiT family protein|nr:type II toxin-antitoxin system MqsA family antitoxin [Oscillospiraceae bacterium]
MYCPKCECDNESEVRIVSETYPVKGEDITIEAQVRFCRCCGNDIWDEELDSKNLKKAFGEYSRKHGLLQPEEIRSIREKYGISQVVFARILGFGDKTITRYENGSIPDATHNNLIYLVGSPQIFSDLLNMRKNAITDIEYATAVKGLKKLMPTVSYKSRAIYAMDSEIDIRYSISQPKWEVRNHA